MQYLDANYKGSPSLLAVPFDGIGDEAAANKNPPAQNSWGLASDSELDRPMYLYLNHCTPKDNSESSALPGAGTSNNRGLYICIYILVTTYGSGMGCYICTH